MMPNDILLGEVGRLLEEGKDVELMTRGSSMHPFIRGDIDSVRLRKVPDETLTVGDIVLAEVEKGRYVLHRIVDTGEDVLTLMGDGNLRGREHCRRENVLGKVTAIVGPSGKLKNPGKAVLWRRLGPYARRVLLAFYRRIVLVLY